MTQYSANPVKVKNLVLTSGGTEYEYIIPRLATEVTFKCREAVDIQYCYIVNESDVEFITLFAGTAKTIYPKKWDFKLYFLCADSGVTVEIETWKDLG